MNVCSIHNGLKCVFCCFIDKGLNLLCYARYMYYRASYRFFLYTLKSDVFCC